MKKAVVVLLIVIACFAMGCSSSKEQLPPAGDAPSETAQEAALTPAPDRTEEVEPTDDPGSSGTTTYLSFDSPWYDTAEELDAEIDGVLLCRVTGESFRVYSMRDDSALPDALDRSRSPMIYTVYSIEPIACFKGDYSELTEVKILGTHIGHNIEAQMAACGYTSQDQVPRVTGKQPEIDAGKLYVFALSQFSGPTPSIHLRSQSVFPVEGDPERIQCDGIMLKDLISLYGEDAWAAVVSHCAH